MCEKEIVVQWFSDPAHGWLKVHRSFLHKLDIADKISQYSYSDGEHGHFVYLEEDCDAPILITEAEKQGWSLTYQPEHTTNHSSTIRNKGPYVFDVACQLAFNRSRSPTTA
jgi:hypothetical protein